MCKETGAGQKGKSESEGIGGYFVGDPIVVDNER